MSKSFSQIIAERRSIRSFDNKEVPDDVLKRVTEKINLCQTAGNQQNYHVYIIRTKEMIESVGKATGQGWVETVPCLFVFCCECKGSYYGRRGVELFNLQDATIAQTYASLALHEEGLKSCWVGGFDESAVSAALNIPSNLRPVGMLPCGYSEEPPRHDRSRKPLEDVFEYV